MSVKNAKNELEGIMRSELCNRCGSCVGLSGGAIEFGSREGKYLPEFRKALDEESCERILQACAGKNFSFPEYRGHFFDDAPHFHPYTGPYTSLHIGFAAEQEVRSGGASGGILSSILIYLLEHKKIDGAIVSRLSHEKPWLTEPFIATTRKEILEAAQSKYIITSVNEILEQSAAFEGRLAYVGLPGQVQSIRKLQKAGDKSVANIHYIFGPYYGNTLHFSSIKSFLKSHGEKDYRSIEKLWFRYGEWPGNMRVEMQNGRVIELKKFHANYLIPFHIVRNSLYCTDFTNEFTDLSGGDAWAPVYEERGKGFSIVMARSQKGEDLIREMQAAGWLELQDLAERDAIEMHSHGYDFKKRGAFIRIRFRKMAFKSIPDYGYKLGPFPARRVVMELIISGLFLLLGTRLARWTVERFSPTFIGKIFEKSRKSWKKSTHNIKRESLG